MVGRRDEQLELRRAPRVRSKGSIQIRRGRQMLSGRVLDLAVGGVCFHADTFGRSGLVGKAVQIDLRLDARPLRHFVLHGHVLRRKHSTNTLAIEFAAAPRDFVDYVQGELLAAVEFDVVPDMVLVDPFVARRGMIAEAFRRSGCRVAEVATPLDAISHLERLQFEPGVIAIADTLPEAVAEELRNFLSGEHPYAHMIAIGKSPHKRAGSASWLSSSDPRGDLGTRVDRLVTAHDSRRRPTVPARRMHCDR